MPMYDSHFFDPPAPLARVSLRNPKSGKTVTNVPMLIDSGADVTLIPEMVIDKLDLALDRDDTHELTGFDGHSSVAESVKLDLEFLKLTFKGRFAVINSESGILGRNVLNHFAVLLDGPRLSWREQKDPAK